MKIELKKITIKDLAEGYEDHAEKGVAGYGGKLDIRPPYQREFIYKDKQRNLVIDTVRSGFPLNVMYWAVREDGGYEVIDGQQRTISICQYVKGEYSITVDGNAMYYHSFQDDEQAKILDYELTVYLCEGTDTEKLQWFERINIAGEQLAKQELRNAVFHGSWTSDAKRYFSKTNCPAYAIGSDYMTGTPIRQDYFETAIAWHANATGIATIEEYMSKHQHDANAGELWHYFQTVIGWVKATFPSKRKEMRLVDWGPLFNEFGTKTLNPADLEKKIKQLMSDDDVTKKPGIYPFVLDGKERHLSIRGFTDNQKRVAFERQEGKCVKCGKTFEIDEMEADHIKPWSLGGKTNAANCQMLCKADNRTKSDV